MEYAEKIQNTAVIGIVKAVKGNSLSVLAGSLQKKVPIYHNPMFPLMPAVGNEVLLLEISGAYVCVGILQK